MRLVKIDGKLWELTCLQSGFSVNGRNIPDDIANQKVMFNKDISDVTRVYSKYKVRAKAWATIEITVNGLPQQYEYDIYLNTKGFYSHVQGKNVFLHELATQNKE